MKNELNITLPEWVFLDGTSHLGDTLDDRVILQHIQSYTILEMLLVTGDEFSINPDLKTKEFNYTNILGKDERHLLVVHFSLASEVELNWIMDRAIEFLKLFMDWDDASLIIEETSKDN